MPARLQCKHGLTLFYDKVVPSLSIFCFCTSPVHSGNESLLLARPALQMPSRTSFKKQNRWEFRRPLCILLQSCHMFPDDQAFAEVTLLAESRSSALAHG